MDYGSLIFTFMAVVFPILAVGGAGLPFVNTNTPRRLLLPIQLGLLFVAGLDLCIADIVAITEIKPSQYFSPAFAVIVLLGTTSFLIWVLFTLSVFAFEEMIYESSGASRDRKRRLNIMTTLPFDP